MRHVSRKKQGSVVTVSLLAIATMLVIAGTVSGEFEPSESEDGFIPNGTPFFKFGRRLSNLQHNRRRHQSHRTVFSKPGQQRPFLRILPPAQRRHVRVRL